MDLLLPRPRACPMCRKPDVPAVPDVWPPGYVCDCGHVWRPYLRVHGARWMTPGMVKAQLANWFKE